MRAVRLVLMLALAATLSACGFALRGTAADTAQKPLPFSSVYLAPGSQIGSELTRQLQFRRDVALVSDPVAAEATLRVVSEEQQKETSAINRAGRITEYRLVYRVTVEVDKHKRPYGEPVTVLVTRMLPYSDAAVLGKGIEEGVVWKSMREDAAQLLMFRLAVLKPVEAGLPPTAPATPKP